MQCPFCSINQSSVIDKRAVKGTGEIRRRRECLKCHRRFTTYERVLHIEFLVLKKDGRREVFDKNKLKKGIEKALEKRPVKDQLENLVNKIEGKIRAKDLKEIDSRLIGQMVLQELRKVDSVAYLRFASVYRHFSEASDFQKELKNLKVSIS